MGAVIRVDDRVVREALAIAPAKVVRGIEMSLRRSAVFGQRQYRINMPAGATGYMRRSATFHFSTRVSVKVEPTAEYADYVDTGTKPHWTSVKNLERWAKIKGLNPYAVQRGIAKHGTKAHPFQDKTASQVERFAGNDMTIQMAKTIKEIL